MFSSKREISEKEMDTNNRKKARRRKLRYWLIIDFTVAFVVIALLLYKPGHYNPTNSNPGISEDNEVSPYLTRLSSEIYNATQIGDPFEITITQEAINDIITQANWPIESEGILLYAPAALFIPEMIVLMGTADFKGVELIITIELSPQIDGEGLINLNVEKVKIGAMNITPLAKITAKKMYAHRLATVPIDRYSLQTQIAASLLNNEPFNPVFKIDHKKIRLNKIIIEDEKLTAYLTPEIRSR